VKAPCYGRPARFWPPGGEHRRPRYTVKILESVGTRKTAVQEEDTIHRQGDGFQRAGQTAGTTAASDSPALPEFVRLGRPHVRIVAKHAAAANAALRSGQDHVPVAVEFKDAFIQAERREDGGQAEDSD
jgi:hypothetical protein